MLALLGTLFGFAGSFFPEVLKYFKQRQDNAHELEMAKLQMEAQAQLHTQRLEEINTQADISESQALYKASEQKLTGVAWIDGIVSLYSSSVRPTITYAFFTLYALVKWGQYMSVRQINDQTTFLHQLVAIWTPDDMAIFCTIISYWFGQRAMRYFAKRA